MKLFSLVYLGSLLLSFNQKAVFLSPQLNKPQILATTETSDFTPSVPDIKDESNKSVQPFDTLISFSIQDFPTNLQAEFQEDFASMVTKYHMLFDRHHYYSINGQRINNLKVINDSYNTNTKLEIDPILYDLLTKSLAISEDTDGYFNLSVGLLTDLWQVYLDRYGNDWYNKAPSYFVEPSESMLSDALACTPKPKDLKKILNFESSNNKHYLTFNGLSGCSDNTSTYSSNLGLNRVSLTLGAVGKGYMVQEVTTFLQNKYPDLSMGYLNGGESSYSVINKPNESAMNVYVLHPDLEAVGFPVPIVNLAINGSFSVSTSADRRGDNYYEIADAERLNVVTRHHIINPLTGYSPNINRSITIVADNAFYLDALSTALLCQSPQAGQSMLKKFNGKYGRVDGLWMSDYNYQDETYNIYVSGDLVDDMSIAEYSSRVKNYYMSDSYNKFIPFDPKLGRPDITEDKGLSSQQVTAIVMIGIVLLAGLFYGILKRKKKSTINAENEPSKNKSQ